MKLATLTIFIFFAVIHIACAQSNKHVVNAGEDINDAIPVNERFHYPQFTTGSVVFRDGQVSVARLNFNFLVSQMQFISPAGDTLAIANEGTIKYININEDTFFYDNGYVQLITGNSSAKLAMTEKIKLGDITKTGAFGQQTSASGITTYSTLHTGGQTNSLTENRELTLVKQISFYLGDRYNHFLPATKKNLMKLFGKQQKQIEAYLKENNTSFNKEEDLKKLVLFMKELSF